MAQVAQPVMVDVQDERERQLRILRKMIRFASFVAFPLLFGFALVSKEFIVLAIGEKWMESARLLQILCLGGAFAPLSVVLYNVLLSKGKSTTYMWCNITQCVILLTLMLVLHPYGIRPIVIAFTSVSIAWSLVWWASIRLLTGYRFIYLLKDVFPFTIIAAAVMVVTWLLTSPLHSLWLLLLVRIAIAALFYLGIMKLARVKILDECIRFITGSAKTIRSNNFAHSPKHHEEVDR